MSALTADRNTPKRLPGVKSGLVAAGAVIFAGALIMRNAAGHIVPASTALNLIGVGRANAYVDNSAGAAGDERVDFETGAFRFVNSAAADEITIADIGAVAYAVDDQTVAKTDGTGTRSPAGLIEDVDALGVWVRTDEALTKIATA